MQTDEETQGVSNSPWSNSVVVLSNVAEEAEENATATDGISHVKILQDFRKLYQICEGYRSTIARKVHLVDG